MLFGKSCHKNLLEKFQRLLDWDALSSLSMKHLFTQTNLERFEEHWNWSKLSENRSIRRIEIIPVMVEHRRIEGRKNEVGYTFGLIMA